MDKLDQFLLLKPFLKMISEGSFFAKIFAWFLRIVACLLIIGFLISSYKLWTMLSMGFDVKLIAFILITQILTLALVYVILNILLVRASDIDSLPVGKDYAVIPIFVIFIKMIGEVLAAFYTIMGITAGFAIWIMGSLPPMIPGFQSLGSSGGFAGGLAALVGGPILGFILLSLFYFLGEQVGVLVDIARNTKR